MMGAGKKNALVIDLCEGPGCRDDLERNLATLKRNGYTTHVASTEEPRRHADAYVPPTQSNLLELAEKFHSGVAANDELAVYANGKPDDGSLCNDVECDYSELSKLARWNILGIKRGRMTFVLPHCSQEGQPLISASDAETQLSPRGLHDRLLCLPAVDWNWARQLIDQGYHTREINSHRLRAGERPPGEEEKDTVRRVESAENAYVKTAPLLSPRQAAQEVRALQKLFSDDRWRVQRFAVRGFKALVKRLPFDEAFRFLPDLRRLLRGDKEVAGAAASSYIAVARKAGSLPPDIADRESVELRQLLPILGEEGRRQAINLYTWTVNGLQGEAARREARAMRALFENGNAHVRNTVAQFYGWLDKSVDSTELHEGAKAIRTILFRDEEASVTLTAIATYERLAPKLNDEEVRTGAIALRTLFEAKESSIRKTAIRLYAKLGERLPPEERSLGAAALAAGVGNPDPYVGWTAADASLSLQKHLQKDDVVPILTALRKRFPDPDPYVRWFAVDTYGSLGKGQDDTNEMREGVIALRGRFEDPDPDVRSAAFVGYRRTARSLAAADSKTEAGILREALAHERDPRKCQALLGFYEAVTDELQQLESRKHDEEARALEVLYCDGPSEVQGYVFSAYRTLLKDPHSSRDALDAFCMRRAYERDTPERRHHTKRFRLERAVQSAFAIGAQNRSFHSVTGQRGDAEYYEYSEQRNSTTLGLSLRGFAHFRRGVYLSDDENNMLTVGVIGAAEAIARWKSGWAVLIPGAQLAVGWRWGREKQDEAYPFYRSGELLLSGGPELRYVPFNNDEPSDLLFGWGGGLRFAPRELSDTALLGFGVQFSYFPQARYTRPEEGVERFFGDEILIRMGVSVFF